LLHSVSKSNCGPNFLKGRLTAKSFQNLLTQLTALLEENKQVCWFQHYAAATHSAKTTTYLQDFSSDHTVRRTLWPQLSADLMPPDFLL
jgi:DNA polymerase III psi subunit